MEIKRNNKRVIKIIITEKYSKVFQSILFNYIKFFLYPIENINYY